MIYWNGIHGEKFELSVASYQFPEATDGYDANWLTLEVSAQNELGSWCKKCACLLTWELSSLHSWIENVAEGNARREFCGLEPDLEFVYLAKSGGQHQFTVILSYGLAFGQKPPGQISVLNLAVTEAQLALTLKCIRKAIAQYPPKGSQGRNSVKSLGSPMENRVHAPEI